MGTILLFTESVNNTNITAHTLQCVNILNQALCNIFTQVPLQNHFQTQICIPQIIWSILNVAPVLNTDTFVYIFPIINLHFSVCWRKGSQIYI